MPHAPGSFLGPYEIIAAVGAGGMGEVYRARDAVLQRDVAVKVLHTSLANDPDRLARFEREAQILASINHPNIAAIYGFESGALIMEFVEGATIADRLRKGAIPPAETIAIARQIISAFDAAHEKGIVHRDLKPANVKITPEGVVKVLDFGLARAVEPPTSADAPTMTLGPTIAGAIMGTPGYMSPEQARGQTVDKRGDIFAFGVLLYEMLSGARAFEGETVSDTLASVLKADPDLAKLPTGAPRELIARCLEKDPRKRLRDMGDALLLLEPAATPTPAAKRRNTWLAPALAAAGLLAGLGIARLLQPPNPTPPLVRFNLTLPEGARLQPGPGAHSIAISPDGQLAVFTARAGSKTQLFLQSFEEATARPLANTEDSHGPFFSPDGQHLAFGAAGMLKRLNIRTGAVDNVAEVGRLLRSGGWNQDGVLIFGTQQSTLFRVPASGGKPQPITALDKARKERTHYWPQFLPDGKHFIYSGMSPDAGKSAIFAAELPSKPGELARNPKLLVASDAAAHFAPGDHGGGHLLYIRDGNLIEQRLDLSSLELSGEPTVVAREVATFVNNGGAEFAVSGNGRLMYIVGGARSAVRLGWHDRTGKLIGEAGDPFEDGGARAQLSPDERFLAAIYPSQQQGAPRFELAVFDLQAATRAGIPLEGIASGFPFWSADGKWIAFSTVDGSIFRIRSDGSAKQLLVKDLPFRAGPFSPDGKYLVVYKGSQPGDDVMLLPLTGEAKLQPLLNSPAREFNVHFSPDGRYFAYASDESGEIRAYVEPFPRRGVKWQISSTGTPVAWRGDGREIILGGASTFRAISVEFRPDGPRFGAPQDLFPAGQLRGVSRDGKKFLFPAQEGGRADRKLPVILNWTNLLTRK